MRIRPIPFPEFRDEVLHLYDPPHRATATRRQVAQVMREIAALEVKTTADLTSTLVARFVEARPPGQSPRTLHTVLRVFRAIANQAVIQGYLRVSPFALRRVSQWVGRVGPPAPKKWFPAGDVRRVLGLMEEDCRTTAGWARWRAWRLYAATSVVALAGLRATECLTLHIGDVHLDRHIIDITARRRLKTACSCAPVPVCHALETVLREYLPVREEHPLDFPVPAEVPWLFPNLNRRGPWLHGSPGTKPLDRLQEVSARAGVPGMTFQSLRASWATRAEGAGYSALTIQRVLRHSTQNTQLWYRAADAERLADTVRDFNY